MGRMWRALARIGLGCGCVVGLAGGWAGQAGAQTAAVMEAHADQADAARYPTSEARYEALKSQAGGGTRHTLASLPDWTGLWTRVASAAPQHARAPLRPEPGAQFAMLRDEVRRGIEWDHLSYCLPAGYPRVNNEPFLKEFIVRPEAVWIANEQQSEIRRVYTNGKGHPPTDELFPLWEGHSIGFWNKDVLVVHTTSLMAFPVAYSRSGPPQSEQMSTVEEWRRISPDMMEAKMTVYDPVMLTRPFQVVYQYARVKEPASRIDLWVCEENNHAVRAADGTTQFVLPGDANYKAPGIAGFVEAEKKAQ